MTFIADIDPTTPAFNDPAGQGDDQIRQLKGDILDSFPNIDAAVNSTPTELNILNGATISTAELNYVLDAGVKQLFIQATAPTGWTLDATNNDRALRIVNTAGGGTGGTTAFSSVLNGSNVTTNNGDHDHTGDTGGTTLTWEQSGTRPHDHELDSYSFGGADFTNRITANDNSGTRNVRAITTYDTSGVDATESHDHSISNDGNHNHDVDLDILYIDAIICTKDAY